MHKFPPLEKEKAVRKLNADGFNVINVPAANSPDKVVIVSYDGTFKHPSTSTRAVVNINWVNYSDTNAADKLAQFTFALKDLNFLVFGKATDKMQSGAEMALW